MAEPQNSTAARWLSIIGIGEDGVAGLSAVAQKLVSSAELVVGGKRHLELARSIIKGRALAWPSPMTEALAEIVQRRGRPVAVLASGDPFNYGVGDLLLRSVPKEETICLPQPSSFSLAASRLGWSLPDVTTVSLHGRALESIVRYLHPGTRILALSWDGTTPAKLAKLLAERGMGASTITVLESLGGPNERIHHDVEKVAALNIIALEVVADTNATVIPLSPGLDDTLFENDGQLTKREVRAVTLAALAPRAGELLWDIGLGAGSIAIEWLLRHPSLKAIGIEADGARAARAARNAARLGTPDLRIVEGRAPQVLQDLPAPDAVFIGGGLSNDAVFEAAWSALKPGGRLVANAVSLATEARLIEYFREHGGELVRLEVSRAGPAGKRGAGTGNVFVWRPAAPIIQWRVRKL